MHFNEIAIMLTLVTTVFAMSNGTVAGGKLAIHWSFPDNQHIDVTFEWHQPTYFALMLGDTMSNSDMWLCSLEKGMKNWTVSDQWSTSHKDPQNDTSLKGTDDLTNKQASLTNYTLTCGFRRKLVTGDSRDKPITMGERIRVCSVVSTTQQMSKHNTKPFCFYWPIIDGFSGDLSAGTSGGDTWALIHGLVMTVGWGLLVDVGIIVARYFRTRRYYIISHAVIFFLVDITTVPMAILMVVLNRDSVFNGYKQMPLSVKVHLLLGVGLVVVIVCHHLLGGLAKHQQESKIIPARRFLRLRKLHRLMGYLLYILTKAQLGVGWYVYGGSFTILVGLLIAWCSLLVIFKIWLEYAYRKHSSFFKRNFKRVSFNDHAQSLIEDSDESQLASMINSARSYKEIRQAFPEVKYVHFKNMVCDVEGFLHPGGNSLLEDVIGRDVSKYIYGGAYVEGNKTSRYRHSAYTIDYLTRKMMFFKSNIVSFVGQEWSAREIRQLAPGLYKFTFHNDTLKMATNPKDPNSYLGRFWLVTTKNGTRPYTVVLCMLDQNINLRNQLLELYSTDFKNSLKGNHKVSTEEVCLLIKRYPRGRVSTEVHEQVLLIEGIFGEGLPLQAGTNIIIAGGTGILPFLDLFDLLLKKCIAKVANLKEVNSNAFDPYSIGYDKILPGVEIILYASFSSLREFNCYRWLTDLHRMSKQHHLQLFRLNLRLASREPLPEDCYPLHGHVDEEFCRRNFQTNQLSRIFVCGPPEMNDKLYQILTTLHFRDRLTIL